MLAEGVGVERASGKYLSAVAKVVDGGRRVPFADRNAVSRPMLAVLARLRDRPAHVPGRSSSSRPVGM
jgi:hypothetical protein